MTVSIRINGGSPDAMAEVGAAETVSFALDSIANVRQVQWSVYGTDETSEPADYTLSQSGLVGQNMSLTSLGAGTSALVRALVNNGVMPDGSIDFVSMSATAKFYVPTASGQIVACYGETDQRDASYGWLAYINGLYRTGSISGQEAIFELQADGQTAQTGGAEIVATAPLVASLPEYTFSAILECAAGLEATARLYDRTNEEYVTGSDLVSTSTSPERVSAAVELTAGDNIYEVHLQVTDGTPADGEYVVVKWARIGP